MGLTEYRLGEFIQRRNERNGENGSRNVKGISVLKQFRDISPKVNIDNIASYKVCRPGDFAFVQTTAHEKVFAYAYNDTGENIIVSSVNEVFYVVDEERLCPEYLCMYLNRPEFDRYARFHSTGSVREVFSFADLCSVKIPVPPTEIQRKYAGVYTAMTEHQRNLSRGLDDLRLVCDMYIEDLRRKIPCERIGDYIREVNSRNTAMITENVKGVNSEGEFIETRASTIDLDFHNYKIVQRNQFVYNPARINIGSIALSNADDCIVSPMYVVFEVSDAEKLLPEYLQLWFRRREFQRSTWFYATGTVRDIFSFDLMQEVRIPIPDIKIQRSIANIYTAYQKRKSLSERLKALIKDACPVLIKGATDEARQMI